MSFPRNMVRNTNTEDIDIVNRKLYVTEPIGQDDSTISKVGDTFYTF